MYEYIYGQSVSRQSQDHTPNPSQTCNIKINQLDSKKEVKDCFKRLDSDRI